jgi:hypothetical protein
MVLTTLQRNCDIDIDERNAQILQVPAQHINSTTALNENGKALVEDLPPLLQIDVFDTIVELNVDIRGSSGSFLKIRHDQNGNFY